MMCVLTCGRAQAGEVSHYLDDQGNESPRLLRQLHQVGGDLEACSGSRGVHCRDLSHQDTQTDFQGGKHHGLPWLDVPGLTAFSCHLGAVCCVHGVRTALGCTWRAQFLLCR